MPMYLLRGFKWARQSIRIHVIKSVLDDVAPEWLIAPASQEALLGDFRRLYPDVMALIPKVHFIEQYDPDDITVKNQDFAYVADVVFEIQLGADVDELRRGQTDYEQWEALCQLRSKLSPNEKMAWYIVYCGDLERSFPSTAISAPISETSSNLGNTSMDGVYSSWSRNVPTSRATVGKPTKQDFTVRGSRRTSITKSIKKLFGIGGSLKKAKSAKDFDELRRKSIISALSDRTTPPVPELRPPGTAH